MKPCPVCGVLPAVIAKRRWPGRVRFTLICRPCGVSTGERRSLSAATAAWAALSENYPGWSYAPLGFTFRDWFKGDDDETI